MSDPLGTIPTTYYREDSTVNTTPTRPIVNLHDCDGNAFAVMARVRRAFREAGRAAEWEDAMAQLTAGDYQQLLATVYELCDVTYAAPPRWCEECEEVRVEDEETCPECGHVQTVKLVECADCGSHYPEDDLNGNYLCSDCEWEAHFAEQEAERELDDEDE